MERKKKDIDNIGKESKKRGEDDKSLGECHGPIRYKISDISSNTGKVYTNYQYFKDLL